MPITAKQRDDAFAFWRGRYAHHRKTKGPLRARLAAFADSKAEYGSVWAELLVLILPLILKWLEDRS